MKVKPIQYRLLADENTSHRLVSACHRLSTACPIVHIASWQDGSWLGLDDAALLMACAEAGLALVAFDRATLPWHAGQVLRHGDSHGGLIIFRRVVRSTDYGYQARLLTDFWTRAGHALGLAQSHRLLADGALTPGVRPPRLAQPGDERANRRLT